MLHEHLRSILTSRFTFSAFCGFNPPQDDESNEGDSRTAVIGLEPKNFLSQSHNFGTILQDCLADKASEREITTQLAAQISSVMSEKGVVAQKEVTTAGQNRVDVAIANGNIDSLTGLIEVGIDNQASLEAFKTSASLDDCFFRKVHQACSYLNCDSTSNTHHFKPTRSQQTPRRNDNHPLSRPIPKTDALKRTPKFQRCSRRTSLSVVA